MVVVEIDLFWDICPDYEYISVIIFIYLLNTHDLKIISEHAKYDDNGYSLCRFLSFEKAIDGSRWFCCLEQDHGLFHNALSDWVE